MVLLLKFSCLENRKLEKCGSVFSKAVCKLSHTDHEKKKNIIISELLLLFHHTLLWRLNQIEQMIKLDN